MQAVEFLQRVFPLSSPDDPRAADVIRFIVVGPNQPWPGVHHFRTRGEIHALDERGISALGFNTHGMDVYFTPHGFTRADQRVAKEDAVPLVDVAWVECDDDDIPPETFSPPPTLAVETSPGRNHLYWVLASPVPSSEIERINYRLTYGNNLKQDKSGWALTKLLRLPGSTSYKRETPFSVQVTQEKLDRIYTLEDFGDLLEAPTVLAAESQKAVPAALRSRQEIEASFSFSKELSDLLDRPRTDRSSALWRIYSLCYRLGMSEEDCYSLCRKSSNDKFTDWRYNGESGLWKDILRGYHMAHTPEDTPVLAKIRGIRTSGIPKPERRRAIAEEILKDLSVRGRVYVDIVKHDPLYFDGKIVTPIDAKTRSWKNFLALRYHIAEGDEDFTAVNSNIVAMAMDTGEPVTPRLFSFWDQERGLLYIYNGGGRIYRLDGREIDFLENGADGVLFREAGTESFQPELPPKGAPTLSSAILSLPNYIDDPSIHTHEQAETLARIWLYGLFFAEHMEARPYLVVTGVADSGKTSLFQMMNVLLSGPDASVQALPADRPSFENIVSNHHHIFFDNVDDQTGRRWLMDALAEVATGIQFNRRVLYSTNETITFKVQCSLGFTTRDAWFSREDIATRIIPLNVERRDFKENLTTLLNIVRKNRGVLWTELLNDLNKVIAVLSSHTASAQTLRMAGYADFVVVVCKAFGLESAPLLNIISGQQKSSALDHSIVWSLLEPWLRETERNSNKLKNNGEWISTSRLHTELRRVAERTGEERDYTNKVRGAKALSLMLHGLKNDLKSVIDVDFVKRHPANEYKFTLREQPAA